MKFAANARRTQLGCATLWERRGRNRQSRARAAISQFQWAARMSFDAFRELVVAFSTGVGLLIVGLAAILLPKRSGLTWAGAVLVGSVAAGLGPVAFDVPQLALIPTAAVIITVLIISALGSRRLKSTIELTYR